MALDKYKVCGQKNRFLTPKYSILCYAGRQGICYYYEILHCLISSSVVCLFLMMCPFRLTSLNARLSILVSITHAVSPLQTSSEVGSSYWMTVMTPFSLICGPICFCCPSPNPDDGQGNQIGTGWSYTVFVILYFPSFNSSLKYCSRQMPWGTNVHSGSIVHSFHNSVTSCFSQYPLHTPNTFSFSSGYSPSASGLIFFNSLGPIFYVQLILSSLWTHFTWI